MSDQDSDTSLWEMLGIPREDATPPLQDNVWDTVLHAALSPDTPEADDSIVPVHDDHSGNVAAGWSDGVDATDHHLDGPGTDDHHDLGGLLHDLGWDGHDLGPIEHSHHDTGHPDLAADFGHDAGHDFTGDPGDPGHDLGGGFEGLGH